MPTGEVEEWCDFLEVRQADLHDAMIRLHREAQDAQLELERFARRYKTSPSTDLRVQYRILSHAMSAIVVEIGMERRYLWRKVSQ